MTKKLTRKRARADSVDFLDRFLFSARGDLLSRSTMTLFEKALTLERKLWQSPNQFVEYFMMALEGVIVSHANRTKLPILFTTDDPGFSGKAHDFLMQGAREEVATSFDQFSKRVLHL